MDKLDINKILNREHLKEEIVQFLDTFEKNKNNLTIIRGVYIREVQSRQDIFCKRNIK